MRGVRVLDGVEVVVAVPSAAYLLAWFGYLIFLLYMARKYGIESMEHVAKAVRVFPRSRFTADVVRSLASRGDHGADGRRGG